ncbi:hypothetical protein Tco_0856236 [Tanacetum coccineum]
MTSSSLQITFLLFLLVIGAEPLAGAPLPGIKLMPHVGKPVNQLEYSRAIGCLMYAMTSTRPDIAYAVGKLSRFTSNPSNHHWEAITRVFRYLKKTMNYGLSYVGFPSVIEGYSDASWITNSEDHTSTTGWVFLLGGGAISWASKKQTCITDSTMESEFVALAAAGKEAEWLRNLIYEIPLWPKPISPISIHCDSAATLAKAYSQIYNGKSRHLGVRHSMVRELITNGVISVDFVRSQQNLADHLTKGLARDLVHKSAIGMGLKCKTKRTTYVSMECRRFKKLGLGFLYAHEGYGRKALSRITLKWERNVGDFSVINVTVDVSPSIPLSTNVVQFLQEDPSAKIVTQSNNEISYSLAVTIFWDVAYDESVGDEFSCGTSIAEVEAEYVVFRL